MHSSPEIDTAQVIRGTWWLPTKDSDGFLVLENSSLLPKQVTASFTGHSANQLAQRQITLASHGTTILKFSAIFGDVRGDESDGGIEIHYSGPAYGVLAYGGIVDETHGYSASPLLWEDHLDSDRPLHQIALSVPGLLLGKADPAMEFPSGTYFKPYALLHNTSGHRISVSVSLSTQSESGAVQTRNLAPLTVPAGATLPYDFTAQFDSSTPLPDGYGNLTVSFLGRDGDLQLEAGSLDQTQSYVFEVIPSAQQPSASRTLCFWSVEGDNDSMVTVWNYTAKPQDLALTLFYTGGTYRIPIHLEAGSAYNLDMMQLVRSRIPDPSGALIPSNVFSGSAVISGAHSNQEQISIAVASSVFNVCNATCGPGCTTCNGVERITMSPNPVSVASGQSVQVRATEIWNTGEELDAYGNWSVSNSSIAYAEDGEIEGIAPGSTVAVLSDDSPKYGYFCLGIQYGSCPYGVGGSVSINVVDSTPEITGIDPSVWVSGTTTPSVTFTGQYFGTNAPTLNFNPGSGISYSLQSYNDNQIVANISVASGTPDEDVQVTVTNNGYGGNAFNGQSGGMSPASQPANTRVQAPTSSPEITVIGWVNASAPDITEGVNNGPSTTNLKTNLNANFLDCSIELWSWSQGDAVDLNTPQDVTYANSWLLQNSGNPAPPASISPALFNSAGQYRLFNDFGNGSGAVNTGNTPFPCAGGSVKWFDAVPQTSQYSGATGISSLGNTYQLSEGRLGVDGQNINATINGSMGTPWIWSVIEFDQNGNPIWSDISMFPTFYIYQGGALVATYPQSKAADFISKGSGYYRAPNQIQ